jgi:alginate O-acetyltransferase complex protein AlgI
MLFNSAVFLYAFLPVAYLVFWRLRTRNQRYVWLTLTGYIFYASWNYRFCALMAFSTLVSYLAGLGMLKWDAFPSRRRLCLIVPVTIDLLLLGFFKYTGLLLTTAQHIADQLGLQASIPTFRLILPLGISFYTFHTISYIVDSYRRTIVPTRNPFEFSCYVSLFCQLVAGPIVRFRQIETDLEHIDSADRTTNWSRAWSFFAIGMIKKIIIADNIAAIIDPALSHYQQLSTLGAWMAMTGYTYQLYFDFSGYSDMAVGLGYLFGLRIPQNFNSPYKATDPADFWRRWHISLSTCLRDYLYIPLGGNRNGRYRNLFLTMLIGGLWHGASWTFVAWGAYHGLLLIIYRKWGSRWDPLPLPLRRACMLVLVILGWVLFRSSSFTMARTLLARMLHWQTGPLMAGATTLAAAIAACTAITQYAPNTFELSHKWPPLQAIAVATCFALALVMMHAGQRSAFLYFQF